MLCALYDLQAHFATVKVSSVSFCTLDPKNKKIFAFINRKKRRNFCHVFQCNEHDVSALPGLAGIHSHTMLRATTPHGMYQSSGSQTVSVECG